MERILNDHEAHVALHKHVENLGLKKQGECVNPHSLSDEVAEDGRTRIWVWKILNPLGTGKVYETGEVEFVGGDWRV